MNIVLHDHTANNGFCNFVVFRRKLASDGLYVVVPQAKLRFPSSIATISSFVDFLGVLLLLLLLLTISL